MDLWCLTLKLSKSTPHLALYLIYEFRYTYINFGGKYGGNLGKLHVQDITTTRDRFPDLEFNEIGSSFVFVANL